MKTLLISACLLGTNCKYSGGNNFCEKVLALREQYHLVPVCPEQLGGLSTPRPPAERLGDRVMTQDGRDVTAQYQAGAREALGLAKSLGCTAAVLKARSPSCGCGMIYDGTFSAVLVPGNGTAAQVLLDAGIPVYTEGDAFPAF
jgi:uncharacterized protein YbbK (DUF523 family)